MLLLKKIRLSAFFILALLGLFSCNVATSDVENDGILVIGINQDLSARSLIQPEIEMVISTYELTLTKGASTVTATIGVDVTSKVFTNLEPGTWSIKAEAKNSTGTIIADGETTADVSIGTTSTASITVVPLSGDGTLGITIIWPENLVADPVISSSLINTEATSENLVFTLTPEGAATTATYTGSWAAGYYTLFMQLKDGDYVLWSRTVTVRMIDGETATGSYTLTEDDLSNLAETETVGAIEFNIGADLNNPFVITISGEEATLYKDESMIVTVNDAPADATIKWFINGVVQTEESSTTITIKGEESTTEAGIELSHGRYWLDVAVNSDGVLNSKTAFLDIPEYKTGDSGPAGGIISYDKGKVTDGWRYMEAWTSDETDTYVWATVNQTVETGDEIGDGYNNTYTVLAGENYPAAQAARDATHGGRGDWFLPSKAELDAMYDNLKVNDLGGFTNNYYWSSSETNDGNAWRQYFYSGIQNYSAKDNYSCVRPVRAF